MQQEDLLITQHSLLPPPEMQQENVLCKEEAIHQLCREISPEFHFGTSLSQTDRNPVDTKSVVKWVQLSACFFKKKLMLDCGFHQPKMWKPECVMLVCFSACGWHVKCVKVAVMKPKLGFGGTHATTKMMFLSESPQLIEYDNGKPCCVTFFCRTSVAS